MNFLRYPMGYDDFAELREKQCVYVDKSLFIEELLRYGSVATLITRPRRFGKTLNMSMLRYFFDINESERSARLFSGLAIEGSPYYAQRASCPVIFLTLKDLEAPTWAEMRGALKASLEAYCRTISIPSELSEEYLRLFQELREGEAHYASMSRALLTLSEVLAQIYGRKVIILIDEYDAPLHHAYAKGYYEEAIDFFRVFWGNALKGNPHLEFAVMTGILRVSKESIFSGLNHLKVFGILDDRFSDKFGFTETEVKALLRRRGSDGPNLAQIKAKYDGYRFGPCELYNPWSVLNCLEEGRVLDFWARTSQAALIAELLKQYFEEFVGISEPLFAGRNIVLQVNSAMTLQHLTRGDIDDLLSLMLFSGYLTVDSTLDAYQSLYEVRIPNGEILGELRNCLKSLMTLKREEKNILWDLRRDFSLFERRLKDLVLRSVSYHDLISENALHMFVLGLFLALANDEIGIVSNREYGEGRPDIACEFPDCVYIFEFKKCAEGERPEAAAVRALAQIEAKRYGEAFVKKVLKIGVGFAGKAIALAKGAGLAMVEAP